MSETVDKITITRADGTTQEFTKGMVATYDTDAGGETATASFNLVGITGKELLMLLTSVIQFAGTVGLFDHLPGGKEEQA
nr:hypothetical protein [uncultured Dysosmobacter sp.]